MRSHRHRRRSIISEIRERMEDIEERLELIEDDIGINSFMSIGEGNVGNVGVGSTAPAAGNVGVGSTAPAGTTVTEPDTSVDGGQSDPAGNVGAGESTETQSLCPPNPSESTETQSLCPPNPSEADGWPRSAGNV